MIIQTDLLQNELKHLFPALNVVLQLRREVRLRKEYLYRKAQEDRQRSIEEKKQKLKSALDGETHFKSHLVFSFPTVATRVSTNTPS